MKMNRIGMRIGVTVVLLGVSLLVIPTQLGAQRAAGMARVGWLEVCGPGPRRPNFDIFRARLAELGFVEGKNLIFEQRFADCRYDRMPGLAVGLVQVPVDVLFTMGTRAARIVAGTVKTTPLVVYSCDPFEHVTRLARQLDASGTPPCAPVCRPRGSDRVGWEDSSSGNPISQTGA